MSIRHWALAVAAAFILPQAALAQEPLSQDAGEAVLKEILAGKSIEVGDCKSHDQEAADNKLANAAWELLKKRDIPGLHAMLPELEAAGNRAPDRPFVLEKCGEKLMVYGDGLAAALMAATATEKDAEIVLAGDLPYADLHFVIGWIYFEDRNYARADEWFVRGLKNDPADAMLASEHADALSRLGRSAEALVFVDTFLADNPKLSGNLHALMLRRRGYCLGELGRHDEAIATYKKALKLEPGNAVAEAEMKWNKDQKKAKKAKT